MDPSGAGGGYDLLIGDPSPAGDAAAHHSMVAAISSFGAGGDWSDRYTHDQSDDHRNMLGTQTTHLPEPDPASVGGIGLRALGQRGAT